MRQALVFLALLILPAIALPGDEREVLKLHADWQELLEWRSLGPANMGGRITSIAVNAADAAHAGEDGMMVSLRGQDIGRVPLADAVRQLKLVPQSRYEDAAAFFG